MKTIRQLRQDHGWTQFELALRVGVQPQTVYLWESGRRMPQVPQLRTLGRLFGICSDEILLEAPARAALNVTTADAAAGSASAGARAMVPASHDRHREETATDE
jgi:DNA-binding XRE family transcriptional regulator